MFTILFPSTFAFLLFQGVKQLLPAFLLEFSVRFAFLYFQAKER